MAQYERLRRLLAERGAVVENAAYNAQVAREFCVPEEDADALALAIRELSAGSVELEYRGRRFRAKRTTE
jgi:putative IMPACT (imprinted ancient) family translation regulator